MPTYIERPDFFGRIIPDIWHQDLKGPEIEELIPVLQDLFEYNYRLLNPDLQAKLSEIILYDNFSNRYPANPTTFSYWKTMVGLVFCQLNGVNVGVFDSILYQATYRLSQATYRAPLYESLIESILRFGRRKAVKLHYKFIHMVKDKNAVEGLDFCYFHPDNSYRDFFLYYSYENLVRLLDKFSALLQKHPELDLHELNANLPKHVNRHYLIYNENGEVIGIDSLFTRELDSFLGALVKRFDREKTMKLLQFYNYRKIRNLEGNYRELEVYMKIVESSRRGVSLREYTYTNPLLHPEVLVDSPVRFSKADDDIYGIGSRTMCCFRIDGLARSLVRACRDSELAYLMIVEDGTHTGFSYAWELWEYDVGDGSFYPTLVLDNYEANRYLEADKWRQVVADLARSTDYERIYLGDSRNDISNLPAEVRDTIKDRPYTPPLFQKNFQSYGFDDSKRIYTILDRGPQGGDTKRVTRISSQADFELSSFLTILPIMHMSVEPEVLDLTATIRLADLEEGKVQGYLGWSGNRIVGISYFDEEGDCIYKLGRLVPDEPLPTPADWKFHTNYQMPKDNNKFNLV